MFDPICDTRSARSKLFSLIVSIIVNLTMLITIIVVAQISAVRSSSERILDRLRRELSGYKMVLVIQPQPQAKMMKATQKKLRKRIKEIEPEPKPLATPNPRILNRLDPRLADFVKDNPAIETIITREIVRDVDSKVLDLQKLLKKSNIEVSFEVDANGHVTKRRVEKSSKVPSIDHLFLEMITLLEKYQFLAPMKGLQRVLASIKIEDQVQISFEGSALDEIAAEEIRKQLQDTLTLTRFALGKSDLATVFENITLETKDRQVLMSKTFEKEPLVTLLTQYYKTEPEPVLPPAVPTPSNPRPQDPLAGFDCTWSSEKTGRIPSREGGFGLPHS